MNGLDLIIQELRGIRADLQAENERPMHIDEKPEQKPMVGIFRRFYNHQGELRWKFMSVFDTSLEHVEVRHGAYPLVTVACNIKRAPRVGTYCKAPAHYMRAAA